MGARRRLAVAAMAPAVVLVSLFLACASATASVVGHIDHVEPGNGAVQVLFSIDGLPSSIHPDLASVAVTLDGTAVKANAVLASAGSGQISRTAVLVVDASQSMKGTKFTEAKAAALTFINQAPADVDIGLVSFARNVNVVQAPTADRSRLRAAVAGLRLSAQTHLYDGIRSALATAGAKGQSRLLVLTDGADTTGSSLLSLTTAVRRAGDQVDVIGLKVSTGDAAKLARIARAGQGTLVNANNPTALTKLFSDEAQALAAQLLVSFPVPSAKAGSDASLALSVDAGGVTYSDNAFVSLGTAPGAGVAATTPLAVANPTVLVSKPMLLGAICAIGVSMLLLLAGLFGVFRREPTVTVEDRLAGYGGSGRPSVAKPEPASMKESALGFTRKIIGSGGFEARLSKKLDAAGLSLKPAEWILLHAALALGAAFIGFLLTSGGGPMTVLFLAFGAVIPWIYLGNKASRRIKAFNAQLSEALQLMSGGLKAGLSLAQAVDTIVREGTEPMAGEFRRALVEARLGVNVEDALDSVAQRMTSEDFRWVVMAVRIQRQVGGNLAELMLTVAGTLREREYLRRQVKTLSAEGRLSAWVLGGLPPLFMVYLVLTQGAYVAPMFHTALGWAMLTLAAILLAVGSFWMSKTVKVEV
jgi:tight adherence protein B